MKKIAVDDIQKSLFKSLEKKDKEYKRVFHGRGGYFEGFEFLTIDFIDTILYVAFFNEVEDSLEKDLMVLFNKLFLSNKFQSVVLQRRYLPKAPLEILHGELPREIYAYENGLKFELNMSNNQNIGFFADMKRGREFVKQNAKDKKVLNLFSYTCAFSVYAIAGEALKSVNVDMSKSALNTGRQNHRINNLDTKNVHFMPYNILKSWNRIKKAGPYDIIIIDPPSFQKGSFAATKDYEKVIKRLPELSNSTCIVLSCLNDPMLDSAFIKDLFARCAPQFEFIKRLENTEGFISKNEETSLKSLVFKYSM